MAIVYNKLKVAHYDIYSVSQKDTCTYIPAPIPHWHESLSQKMRFFCSVPRRYVENILAWFVSSTQRPAMCY
jgi:hypothetical protein